MPIPFSTLRDFVYETLAAEEWKATAGMPPFSVSNEGLIVSALAEPFQTVGGVELYPTVPAKAACLFRGLVKNHGLADGNKRMAVTALGAFLLFNGWHPAFTNTQLYRYALRVANRAGDYPVKTIEQWIRRHAHLAPPEELAKQRKLLLKVRDRVGGDFLAVAFPRAN
jgi:death-on-curing protein